MATDELRARRIHDAYAWLVIAFFGALYAGLSRLAFDAFPYSGDEYSMYLQAEAFARGVLHTVAPPHANLMALDHVVIDQWVRSKYPFGSSALLALGVRAGFPWLVAPVEGGVTLGLAWWTAKRELGAPSAWITLLLLALAPLFVFHSATFYSHAATTMWLALAFAAVAEWTHGQKDRWLVILGIALGCAFVTRPADAVFFGAALLVLRSARLVVVAALSATPFLGMHLWYQAKQFGSPFMDGYRAYNPMFVAAYGEMPGQHALSLHNLVSGEELFHHLDVCRAFIVDWTVTGSALLALMGAYALGPTHAARAMRNVAVAVVVVLLGALLVTAADPDDGARPRYLSTALLSMAFLAGPGWFAVRATLTERLGERTTRVIAAVALVFAPVQIGSFLMRRVPLQWEREGLYRAVEALRIEKGIVVVRARYPTRYARNGPFFDRPVLYLSAPAAMSVAQIAESFPGTPVYEAMEGQDWVVFRRL